MVDKLIGKKIGMTRYFIDEGNSLPVTIVKAGPCVVIQKKTQDKDGYEAIQVGFEEQKAKRLNKPIKGHLEKGGLKETGWKVFSITAAALLLSVVVLFILQ